MPVTRLSLFLGLVVAFASSQWCGAEDKVDFKRDIRPVLQQRCFSCHGAKKQAGDFRMDKLQPQFSRGPDAERWHDILNRLNKGEMPPKKAPPLKTADRRLIVAWIGDEIKREASKKSSTGGRVVMRRLTRYEYSNTLRDLLGLKGDFSADLPPESPSKEGFRNNGAVLGISPLQVEYYLKTARRALDQVIVTGAQPEVYRRRATESAKVRRVKGSVSNRLGPHDRFLLRMDKFPRRGEVRVRVRARAETPSNSAWPRLRVAMGVRADVLAPEKTMGIIDVQDSDMQTFEFRGRVEDFPLPGHNPKYPGLQISLYHDSDLKAKPKKKKGKRNKKNKKVQPEEPTNEPRIVIEWVEFEGPIYASWPPRNHRRIFVANHEKNERAYAATILKRFMKRAYRRPVESADVAPMLSLFDKVRPHAASFELAIRDVLTMVLVSPEFLYMVESQPAQAQQLTKHELATRLSYFLWSSMPDDQLLKAAEGRLSDSAVLARQAQRMLDDDRSWQFVVHFTDQWLDLPGLDRVAVNPEFYPNFDDGVKVDMRLETQHFFRTILREDLSCLNFLDSEFALLNRRMAQHYGMNGPRGSAFEKIVLSDDRRGGLLAQASFHLLNSNGEDSHPIKRAVWVLDRLLDDPPAPPPPDVPELDPNKKGLIGLSLKQQLEAHRSKAACNDCHRRIDPWGVAFENYDALGIWRTSAKVRQKGRRLKTMPVDASAELPDGTAIEGPQALRRYLIKKRAPQFARGFVRHLLTYALGRSLEVTDSPFVDKLTDKFIKNGYRMKPLILAIVDSPAFRTK